MSDNVKGKRFVILGGSSGIGFAVAKLVLEQGAGAVVVASSNRARVDDAVRRLASASTTGGEVSGRVLDMTTPDHVVPFFADLGPFDHLVSTAGSSLPPGQFPDTVDLARVAATAMNDRFWSVLRAVQCCHGQIRPGGTVTLTAGTVVRRPMPGWTAVAGVAGAVESASRGLAVDLAPVRVNCVVPGVVDTDLWRAMEPAAKAAFMADHAGKLPVGHVGTAEEVAESYLYCFRCSYLTGQSLYVEGGALLV